MSQIILRTCYWLDRLVINFIIQIVEEMIDGKPRIKKLFCPQLKYFYIIAKTIRKIIKYKTKLQK